MAASGEDEAPWRITGRVPLHSGRMRLVEHAVVLPSGAAARFEVDESVPFAVAVLVVLADLRVVLTRQYRHAIGRWIHDLPGGAAEPGERPEEAARRECEEETGLVPDELVPLHVFFPNPGRSAWPVHLFVAPSTRDGTARSDDEAEQVRRVLMPLEQLDRLVLAGEVVDPSLLVARFMAGARGHLPAFAGAGAP